jgi:hypothetical protein
MESKKIIPMVVGVAVSLGVLYGMVFIISKAWHKAA